MSKETAEKLWLAEQQACEDEILSECSDLCNNAVSNMMPKIREKALETSIKKNGYSSDLVIHLKFDLTKKKPKITAETYVPPIIEQCRKF